ncbi:Kynureninase [compost metagenome]
MYKSLYSRFLNAHPQTLHFACHSHHYWPDVSREAHLQYWDDSCQHVDDKWSYIFSEKIPRAQKLIAEALQISRPEQIVFAPNTHEFVMRLASSLDWSKKVRILTTDSEFYSFDRQMNRLSELSQFEIVKVPTLPFHDFHERFESEMQKGSWDMIFLSQVFFNSALVADVERLAMNAASSTMFVIDGYHGFMAVPTSLKSIENRVFYVAGSYKYAQGGEGACFLVVPSSAQHRPFYTGWFAELSHLHAVGNEVGYPQDALQYAGSTMDFSGLYRLIATLEKFRSENLTVQKIHQWVQQNQKHFLDGLAKVDHPLLSKKNLIVSELDHHGHFLTFNLPSTKITAQMVEDLKGHSLITDSRGSRLRFGFGLYHDAEDMDQACTIIGKLK